MKEGKEKEGGKWTILQHVTWIKYRLRERERQKKKIHCVTSSLAGKQRYVRSEIAIKKHIKGLEKKYINGNKRKKNVLKDKILTQKIYMGEKRWLEKNK